MKEIGKHLRHYRKQKKLSTSDVHALSGGKISQSYVVQIESGKKIPSLEKLLVLAEVYKVDIHELVDIMIDKGHAKKAKPTFVFADDEVELIQRIRKLPDKRLRALLDLLFDE